MMRRWDPMIRRTPMPPMLFRLLLLAPVLWLSACATVPDERRTIPADDLTLAVQAGDCRTAFDRMDTATGTPTDADTLADRRLRVAQICLQTGDFARARRASTAFLDAAPSHPDADYAAYLRALAGFGEWSRATAADPEVRIREGRAVSGEIILYLRERPLSQFSEELAPRLVRLREGIAAAELALAQDARQRGDRSLARARADYVLEYYPRTQAAADAARLLMEMAAP
jgi:outer membrane protein assembly factor BamD